MRATPAVPIDETTLVSSTVAEPHASEIEYDPAAVYALGDRVVSVARHRTYESLAGTSAEVTLTIAAPCVVSWPNHDLAAGTQVAFVTDGDLPDGLAAATVYYVIEPASNSFQLAASKGGAAIETTGVQSGTHTAIAEPNIGRSLDDTAWWLDVGMTRRWAMFDLYRNTGTVDASPLTIVIEPGQRVDTLGFIGLNADSITVTVEAGNPLEQVYSFTRSLIRREVTNWYEYFFAPFEIQSRLSLFDIPPFVSNRITITLEREGGEVSCDTIVAGSSVWMGDIEFQPVSDVLNFSTIDRDRDGRAILVPRRNVPKVSLTIWCPKGRTNLIRKLRDDLNAAPALWTAIDDSNHPYFEAVQMVGVYKRLSLSLEDPNFLKIAFEAEEI